MSSAALAHSVVIPLYNEEGNVRELVDRLVPVLERTEQGFEIVFVDDGSRDQTSAMVRAASTTDPRVKLVRFSRNYGQEAAVQAGILHASGRWIVQMDGDLQNPPEELTKLLAKRDEGYEIVYGVRTKRRDPLHRVLASRMMLWFMRSVLDVELPEDVTTFRVIEGGTARLIAGLPEKKKFFSALAVWTGARATSVPVEHAARTRGVTKYNLGKLVNHTFDLMVGFSTRPLRIIGVGGAIIACLGLGFGLFRIAQKLLGADITMGYTSLFSAIVILGGLQLIALSVIGEYIARIFIQTQDRPLYNIAEKIGFGDEARWVQSANDGIARGAS
ncbi:MAG TPA: glycosyltransferase family 2 protein [Polyangiaceae bacterium]|nr:glycosyltransferase family 2 protein [Polyangiaceae bacterium]